ncbi:MAG: hypothetical protein ACTSRA_18700, partial [Promethearchaeota archaeon]
KPAHQGFDIQQYSNSSVNTVIIRGADVSGFANGIFWFIDRCKTQDPHFLIFDYFRNPVFDYRITTASVYMPGGDINSTEGVDAINYALHRIQDAARRGASHLIFFGNYIGQYPDLLNFSWLPKTVYQANYEEIDRRRDYAKKYVELAHQYGLKVLFWADQLNYISPSIKEWFEETGEVSIYNQRVKNFVTRELVELFTTFPSLDGIALRVGDDLYAKYSYKLMHTPDTFKDTTNAMMNVINQYNKMMMLRTWQMSVRDDCVHASRSAYLDAFGDMNYENLIISYKYTPNDYQRIPLNPTANVGNLKQVVELQTTNSFENYQHTPLCMAAHYEQVLSNLTSFPINSNETNLLHGIFNMFTDEVDLVTSNIEGPGSANGFQFEPNYYYIQRASWEPNVSAVEVCKDLAARILGWEYRENFYRWFYISEAAHWHLFYLPYHREHAPWLKSRWFHYTRYFNTNPQAFGYVYYYCKQNISEVIASVKEGVDLAIEMKNIVENVSYPVNPRNKIYIDYFNNMSIHFVDFANLTYLYIKTAMYYWRYVEVLDLNSRRLAYSTLPLLKSVLNHYNSTYHYYTDPEKGHKPGLESLYGFVHWMEVHETIEIINWIVFSSLSILILLSIRYARGIKSRMKKIRKTRNDLVNSESFTGINEGKYWNGTNIFLIISVAFGLIRFRDIETRFGSGIKCWKRTISGVIYITSLAFLNGLLLTCASFFNFSRTVFLYAFTTSLFIAICIFGWFLLVEFITITRRPTRSEHATHRSSRRPNIKVPRLIARAITKSIISITPVVLLQVVSAFVLALKGPIGFFDSPIIFQMLSNPKFLDFTPVSLEGMTIILMLFGSIISISMRIGGFSYMNAEKGKIKWIFKVLFGLSWIALMILSFLAMTISWFPDILTDIDFYLNNAIGTYQTLDFYP